MNIFRWEYFLKKTKKTSEDSDIFLEAQFLGNISWESVNGFNVLRGNIDDNVCSVD